MALQKVFKPEYILKLKNEIDPEKYRDSHFVYDESQVRYLAGVTHTDDLLGKLVPTTDGDIDTAIAIYEAFERISPVFAQQDDLWVYLTHVDLFDYVKVRWKLPEDATDEAIVTHIEHHWFRDKFQFMRTTFAGFWWNVKLTVDNGAEDKYELTRYLFRNTEFRTSSFGELPLIRYSGAMKGILEFVRDNEEVFESGFNAKARYIRHLFDILGGYKNLASLPKEYFYNTLNSKIEIIKEVHEAKDVKAGATIFMK